MWYPPGKHDRWLPCPNQRLPARTLPPDAAPPVGLQGQEQPGVCFITIKFNTVSSTIVTASLHTVTYMLQHDVKRHDEPTHRRLDMQRTNPAELSNAHATPAHLACCIGRPPVKGSSPKHHGRALQAPAQKPGCRAQSRTKSTLREHKPCCTCHARHLLTFNNDKSQFQTKRNAAKGIPRKDHFAARPQYALLHAPCHRYTAIYIRQAAACNAPVRRAHACARMMHIKKRNVPVPPAHTCAGA